MNNELKDKYFVKKSANGEWSDLTTMFQGLKILKIDGYDELGKPVNIYTAQYIDNQEEDFIITQESQGSPVVIRENVDLEITFIVSDKYATQHIDVRAQHDSFISYMTNSDVYIKSKYVNKEVRCVCLEGYKPTTERLQRGLNSYITGTLKLHTLKSPVQSTIPVLGNLYIGFGGEMLYSFEDITSLANVEHFAKNEPSGNYAIQSPSTSYMWICSESEVGDVMSITNGNTIGFVFPMEDNSITIGTYHCYRSANSITQGLVEFTILPISN